MNTFILLMTIVMYNGSGSSVGTSIQKVEGLSYKQCVKIGNKWRSGIPVSRKDSVFFICEAKS